MTDESRALAVAKKDGIAAVVNRLFATKTPKQFIKMRPGPNGMAIRYVEIGYVTNELNKAFGPFWEFKVVDKGIGKKQIWVQGQLTIKDPKTGFSVTKETFGGSDIKVSKSTGEPIDIANDLKAAVSDCTKKCASMFGIAADVFFKEQDKYDQMDTEVDVEAGEDKSTKQIVMAKFFATADDRGINAEEAKERIKIAFGAAHMEDLTLQQLEATIKNLEKNFEVVGSGEVPRKIGALPQRTPTPIEKHKDILRDSKLPDPVLCRQCKKVVAGENEYVFFCNKECNDLYWNGLKAKNNER